MSICKTLVSRYFPIVEEAAGTNRYYGFYSNGLPIGNGYRYIHTVLNSPTMEDTTRQFNRFLLAHDRRLKDIDDEHLL